MIKAVGRAGDGKLLLLLGITEQNVKALRRGQPIMIPVEELDLIGVHIHIAIHYGATEEAIKAEIVGRGVQWHED